MIGWTQQVAFHRFDGPVAAKFQGDGFHDVDAQGAQAFDAQFRHGLKAALTVIQKELILVDLDCEATVFQGGADLFQFVGCVGLVDSGDYALGLVKKLDVANRSLRSEVVCDDRVVGVVGSLVAFIPEKHPVVFCCHVCKPLRKAQLGFQHAVHVEWQGHGILLSWLHTAKIHYSRLLKFVKQALLFQEGGRLRQASDLRALGSVRKEYKQEPASDGCWCTLHFWRIIFLVTTPALVSRRQK